MATRKADPVYSLPADYLVDWKKSGAFVRDVYGTIQAASAWADTAYARWRAINRTDDGFLNLSLAEAAIMDAVWKGSAGPINGQNQSRSSVYVGAGKFGFTMHWDVGFGQYTGQGTSKFYSNGSTPSGGTIGQGGTELYIEHARWQGDPKVRNLFQSSTWSREDLYGYNEAFYIDNFRLEGGKASESYDSTLQSSGIAIWDMGSCARIGRVFSENWNTAGLHVARGTPVTVEQMSSFRNNLAGVWLQGGGMHSFGDMEFDENPAMFYVNGGYGRDGGTMFDCKYIKAETGKAPGRPVSKGQCVMDATGWTNANFSSISYAAVNSMPEVLFRIDATYPGGPGCVSSVNVDNLRLFGPCRTAVHGVAEGKKWKFDGSENLNGYWNSRIKSFYYTSAGGGQFITKDGTPTLTTGCAKNRLAVSDINPNTGAPTTTWNDQAGLPVYQWGASNTPAPGPSLPSITSFTATPATISAAGEVTLAWTTTNATSVSIVGVSGTLPVNGSAKVNVTSTTSYTMTATNASGSVSQAVTVTLSSTPPGTPKLTRTNVVMTGTNTIEVLNPVISGVTAVRVTDLVFSNLNYPRIVGTGTPGKNSLMVWPDGTLHWNGGAAIAGVPKMTAGAKYSGTIPIPSSNVSCLWQDAPNQGGGAPGSCARIELL